MRLVADLHIHTVASGHAYSTVLEIAQAAAAAGLELIALTDHGPAMPGAPHAAYFGNLAVIPDRLSGVRVLKGVEANVLDRDGTLDLDDRRLSRLDIVLAGLHSLCTPGGTREENTAMLLNVMKNSRVDAIVHPGNPEFPIDAPTVVRAAAEYGVALEINNSSLTVSRRGSRPYCDNIVALAKDHGCKLLVGSDSHFALAVGNFAAAEELLTQCRVPAGQVLNTSAELVLRHLGRHKGRQV